MNAGNMYGAMVPIAQAVGTGASAVIGFNDIPQTYQDLLLVCNLLPSSSSARGGLQLNNDGASNYSWTYLSGDGSSASSARASVSWIDWYVGAGVAATNPTTVLIHILNYANTSTFKTALMRTASDQNGSGISATTVGLYRSTSAVSAVSITTLNGAFNWNTSSTATLYGIRAVSS
jgi:hypothetical protein